jgi:ABC-type phosphate transport system auxiliary subunit
MNTIESLIMTIVNDLDDTKIEGFGYGENIMGTLLHIRNNVKDKFIVSTSVRDLDKLFPNAIKKIGHALDVYKELKDRLEIEGMILDDSSFNTEKEQEEALENRRSELRNRLDILEEEKKKIELELS